MNAFELVKSAPAKQTTGAHRIKAVVKVDASSITLTLPLEEIAKSRKSADKTKKNPITGAVEVVAEGKVVGFMLEDIPFTINNTQFALKAGWVTLVG